jgi:hypothetical protein
MVNQAGAPCKASKLRPSVLETGSKSHLQTHNNLEAGGNRRWHVPRVVAKCLTLSLLSGRHTADHPDAFPLPLAAPPPTCPLQPRGAGGVSLSLALQPLADFMFDFRFPIVF